ncbi:hypothetical protein OESDEN_03958 [Oesophagostomum dentatum]|uniref:Uncharacterized protein n=1 Tax=Oesophagostomum dentatum TaxID=61180 RepID=A0A0B1TL13_OESDE|nr:hypothetical protein OESDEN_03958 [Oesophagostomum dentatum]
MFTFSHRFHQHSKMNTRKRKFSGRLCLRRVTSWERRNTTTTRSRSGSKRCTAELASSRFILSLRSDQFLLFHCLVIDRFTLFALV